MSGPLSSRFSPYLLSEERLDALLVARHGLLARLVEDHLEAISTGAARFDVLTGPRGAGKSHLLALAGHRLERAAKERHFLVARLGEEEHPSGLVDLLARALGSLQEEPELPPVAEQLTVLRKTPRDRQLEVVQGLLLARARERGVVLVLENLDRVLDALGLDGQHGLRAFLHRAGRWSILSSSCTWPEALSGARRPFYQTFQRIDLPLFTDRDAHAMLVQLARAYSDTELERQLCAQGGYPRVRAMRFLLGPNPRAMALLFPFLRGRQLDDLEGAFFDLAEELTPYYQDQMSRLPPGQRSYLEQLAASWEPLSVNELAERCFASPNTASGQLRYLARDMLVRSHRYGRESFYELAEPLHRLAAAMKRPDRVPATLARVIAVWLEREEIHTRWIAAGMIADRRDPWYLALQGPAVEETGYDRAVAQEIERFAVDGDRVRALEMARRCWDERPTERLALALLDLRLGHLEAEEIRQVWVRFPTVKIAARILSREAFIGQGVDLVTLGEARRLLWDKPVSELAPGVAALLSLDPTATVERIRPLLPGIRASSPAVLSGLLARLMERDQRELLKELLDGLDMNALDPRVKLGLIGYIGQVSESGWPDRTSLISGLPGPQRASAEILFAVQDKELEEASAKASEALQRWPEDPLLAGICGMAMLSAGNPSGAISPLEFAVHMRPEISQSWELLFRALFEADEPARLLAQLDRAMEHGHESAGFRELRFAALVKLGRIEDAVALGSGSGGVLAIISEAWATARKRHSEVPTAAVPIELRLEQLVEVIDLILQRPGGLQSVLFLRERNPEAFDTALALAVFRREIRRLEAGEPVPAQDPALLIPEALSPLGPLLDALRALPDDASLFVRLAAPERAALRGMLRSLGAARLLHALPSEDP